MNNEQGLLIWELNLALKQACYNWRVLDIDGDEFILDKPDPSGVIASHLKMTRLRLEGKPHPLPGRSWDDWEESE
jgi:hypothetical protein